ncbi:MAG: hypothetical protein KKC79_20210 [Gammaproteobacteria bacterium]|nr:hypothetical protein [Gammaproteobacteria bacterium]MBU1441719.1 hypothetical protein [Gammaproteobacteria bacterium]MBU2287956.1 hypothetical protein [Gammaproteobacteria bacterium]MBU2410961.1 hypothetical protein [Gammaproteobacteria bacterium]
MKQQTSDTALLQDALTTLELVLARADSDMHGAPYHGPTVAAPLDDTRDAGADDELRFRSSAAQSAISICLSSAAALIDVSQALLNRNVERTPSELEREWKTMITHTKTASRSAYRAALIMTEHRHVLAAQGHVAGDTMHSLAS